MTTPAPPTATLAAWLEKQVAADEALARAAHYEGQHWYSEEEFVGRWPECCDCGCEVMMGANRKVEAEFVAANDPAQTLRRVAAIRQVLALHGPHDHATLPWVCASCAEGYEGHGTGTDWHERVPYPCPTLRALASMFADRDGYRAEEWA